MITINRARPLLWGCILLFTFLSCKERNELYPPLPWKSYFYQKDNIAPRPISAIYIENDHSEWYGSLGNEGVIHNNGFDWTEYRKDNSLIDFDSVTCIRQDGVGRIWVSWKSGLAFFDGIRWKTIEEFFGKKITSIAIQGIGIVWVGIDGDQLNGGLGRISDGRVDFFRPATSGILSSHITALTIDADQQIWIGSSDNGVTRYNGNEWVHITQGISPDILGKITSFTIDNEGIVWAGCSTSNLVKITNSIPVILSTGSSKPVSCLVTGKDGKIWIGTSGAGILINNYGTWSGFTKNNLHLPSDSIITLSMHPDGNVLASFPDGNVIYFK